MEDIHIMSPDAGKSINQTKETPQTDTYPLERGFLGNVVYELAVIASLAALRFTSEGKENIPEKAPYVIAANHQTFVDGMWIAHFLPRKHFDSMCCLAGADLGTSYGIFGKLIMRVGQAIAVERYGNPVRGLIKAKKEVENGRVLLVHPEGTRTHDGKIAEFKDGAAYLAVKANAPILPVYIEGGYQAFSRHMKRPHTWDHTAHRRKKVVIHYGKPLYPEEFGKDAHKLTAALTEWMLQMEKNAN